MQAVLRRTLSMAKQAAILKQPAQSSAKLELRLIQSLDDIRNPPMGCCYVEQIGSKENGAD
ncbi:hypothetical protein FGIG_05054 [Fasciola gigantica]|uniref:Uncharacterized protein n=1 Tax=Fasciola gigantica TaxID=46835 RepID=A0A504YLE4_FASGI|nr:hypothetical protein FGIG_05054 [Fasciola gigantica]